MTQNEIVQWSIAGIIVLVALVWATVRAVRLTKRKGDGGNCGCCSQSSGCKARELKSSIGKQRQENCRDGQSARN